MQKVFAALSNETSKCKNSSKATRQSAWTFSIVLSERCITFRLAMYLQNTFPECSVDAGYNRKGASPKTLRLPEQCANYRNNDGDPFVVPDIIAHQRGAEGPNVLVLELKKTTNRSPWDCDRERIREFREQLNYGSAALIECETRRGHATAATIAAWL